jgi:3-hydroxyacyl-CoA dehydrogenase
MNINDVKKIAIIGSGAMGHGIGQVCAQAGYTVVMRDIKQEFLDNAISKARESLALLVSKGRMSQPDMDKAMGNLKTTLDVKDAVAGAQIVIEAVPEIMDLKKTVFKDLSDIGSADAILATNTSSMSISEIGSMVKYPARFVGSHFFNPANRMKLVEVIYGDRTSDATADLMCEVSKKIGKRPVKVMKDRPGFIVNRINAPVQALMSAILDEGKIQPQELDAMLKRTSPKMALFETADFVGLDVFCHTLDCYAKTLSPQYKPGKYLKSKLDKKELGMKSGKGIYTWQGGKAQIDTSKETQDITPVHLIAVRVNEAVKIWKEGLALSVTDIDDAVKYGMNDFAGPFARASGMQPEQLLEALNTLQKRYGLDLLEPEPEIVDGSFKNIGR